MICPSLEYVLNWGITNNNGNLQSVDEYNGGLPVSPTWLHFNQSYLYDGVSRLSYALDSSSNCSPAANYACWFRKFQYDDRGNMWVPTAGIATGKAQHATQVNIRAGMDSSTLQETAVHEGVHVEDRENFVNSIRLREGKFRERTSLPICD